jgi:Carboxypeptidase regulatory-like domain
LSDVRVRVGVYVLDVAVADPKTRIVDARPRPKRLEAKSDAKGEYRLEIPGIRQHTRIVINAVKPGYRSLRGPLMSQGDEKRIEVVPGTTVEAPLILKAGIYFAGIVVDEQGKPIPGVIVDAYAYVPGVTSNIEKTVSTSNGSFELFAYPVRPLVRRDAVEKGHVIFVHPDYIDRHIEDVYAIEQNQREALRIVLATGYKLAGKVLDLSGKPVPKAMVRAVRKDKTHRKATLTDANGNFALRGLSEGLYMLTARALEIRQQTYLPMALKSDQNDLEIRLKPIEWPADLKRHAVLGMQLADVTAELKSTYDLFDDRGALILDPGKDSDRLKIGRLAEGYTFRTVGRTRIGSVSEFVSQILAETAGQNADEYSVRVVYSFSRVDTDGNGTATLRFTKDDLKQLQSVSDQFTP